MSQVAICHPHSKSLACCLLEDMAGIFLRLPVSRLHDFFTVLDQSKVAEIAHTPRSMNYGQRTWEFLEAGFSLRELATTFLACSQTSALQARLFCSDYQRCIWGIFPLPCYRIIGDINKQEKLSKQEGGKCQSGAVNSWYYEWCWSSRQLGMKQMNEYWWTVMGAHGVPCGSVALAFALMVRCSDVLGTCFAGEA